MIKNEDVYKVGVLGKPHGVQGELIFNFTDDAFDRVNADYLFFSLDGIYVPFFIEEYRFINNDTAFVKFEDIDTEGQAQAFAGVDVFFPFCLVEGGAPTGNLSWSYFVGFSVEDLSTGNLGYVKAIDDRTQNTLFVVERPDGEELLIPAQESFVVGVNSDKRELTVDLPDGLLNLDEI